MNVFTSLARNQLGVFSFEAIRRAEGRRFNLAPVLFDGIVTPAFMTIKTTNTRIFGKTATSGFLAGMRGPAGVLRCFHAQMSTSMDNGMPKPDSRVL
jgi:hypothetical protein